MRVARSCLSSCEWRRPAETVEEKRNSDDLDEHRSKGGGQGGASQGYARDRTTLGGRGSPTAMDFAAASRLLVGWLTGENYPMRTDHSGRSDGDLMGGSRRPRRSWELLNVKNGRY